ncbi:hypothetical protein [Fluviibacterium sp. S390]|uniref:hypothetical protein n=1 Tax=Fluviibacterium sp. S390 TaxID=3415139 RepID=UPI003C7B4A56
MLLKMLALGLSLTFFHPALAQDKTLLLTVPSEIADSGLWRYILPRFALKTGVRVTLGADGEMELTAAPGGAAVLQSPQARYAVARVEGPHAARFADWLRSDVGRRTIASFTPEDGDIAFSAPEAGAVDDTTPVFDGDAARGEVLSYSHCGRCHVVGARNRMNGLGSTPSFGVLRSMDDWSRRFEAFYALNPHGAFTQIAGVTPPFPETLPSPIAPVEMSLDDLEAILAFVSVLAPADLGAPLQHQ